VLCNTLVVETGTNELSVANMSSVCFLKRCIEGLVKSELPTASSKTFSACERRRSREVGDLKAEPAERRSQLELMPLKAERGLLSFHSPRSASHESPSPVFAPDRRWRRRRWRRRQWWR